MVKPAELLRRFHRHHIAYILHYTNNGRVALRVAAGGIKEVVFALSSTIEGDTTNFYIYRKLEKLGVKLSVIARGISVGDELEYADEVTLGRSIVNRTPFTGAV
jgi:recombination protein RecR